MPEERESTDGKLEKRLHTHRAARGDGDRAYNVLLTEGSVKTFSDAAGEILKSEIVNYSVSASSLWACPPAPTIGEYYKLYFDPLYAQD